MRLTEINIIITIFLNPQYSIPKGKKLGLSEASDCRGEPVGRKSAFMFFFLKSTEDQLTGGLAHAIDFHEWQVETHKEVERILHNWCRSSQTHANSVKAEGRPHRSEDQPVSQRPAIRHCATVTFQSIIQSINLTQGP